MPVRLSTTIDSISSIPNSTNSKIIFEFHQYMKSIGISESYQNGNLKIIIYFARFLGSATDFLSVIKKEQILCFLDTRIKDTEFDPEKRWIRTWNDYLQRIKYFFRWLYNKREQEIKGIEVAPQSDWPIPSFIQITEKKTKRISPYLESELWERDELRLLTGLIHDYYYFLSINFFKTAVFLSFFRQDILPQIKQHRLHL